MSSGFVTETEIAEVRKKRQEEWEKVRKPDEPEERPEEAVDSRSLFERLKEQKMKKDLEYEEAHKLKNLIRGLDDDEVEFLDFVDRTKMNVEKQQQIEEEKELKDFRQRVATLQEESSENKIQLEAVTLNKSNKSKLNQTITRPSQKSILSGIVIRKRKNGNSDDLENGLVMNPKKKQQKQDHLQKEKIMENGIYNDDATSTNSKTTAVAETTPVITASITATTTAATETLAPAIIGTSNNSMLFDRGAFKCIGILPGIGRYKESSDSEISTDSEEEAELHYGQYDLTGRQFQITKKCRDGNDD